MSCIINAFIEVEISTLREGYKNIREEYKVRGLSKYYLSRG